MPPLPTTMTTRNSLAKDGEAVKNETLQEVFSQGGIRLPRCIISLVNKFPVIYDANSKGFCLTDARGVWIPVTDASVSKHISNKLGIGLDSARGYSNLIQQYLTVDLALPLAGYRSGVYSFDGHRILVTRSPHFIEPRPGNSDLIEDILEQLLGPQHSHFKAWCKLTDEAYRNGIRSNLHCLVLVGPKDCCKSRVQHWLITPIRGGRHVDCYNSIKSGDRFTAHLFHAEHHMVEDKAFEKDYRNVNNLGTYMKNVAANDSELYHKKHGTPLNLPVFRRLSVSCNNNEENVRILPPIDDSMLDKVSAYYCNPVKIPCDTQTMAGRLAFEASWKEQLPHWLYHLQRWQIPEELRDNRTGLQAYQSRRVLSLINQTSPEHLLYEIIVVFFNEKLRWHGTNGIWKGSAAQLQNEMRQTLPEMRHQLNGLTAHSSSFGGLLANLYRRDKYHKAMVRANPQNRKTYTIRIAEFIEGGFWRQ
jgi:hypothetical protein